MPFPEPQRTEVDGLPVWFTDVPGPCMGGLVFRVGRCDESLVTSGINHIIEHLALGPLLPGRLDMNGTTAALTTSFYVSGDQASVEAFLMQVCQNLSALPYERLDLERRILQTEGQQRSRSFADAASVRFGARGIGVVDWMETGLEHLTSEQVESWRRARFTRPNAVAWMTRSPSSALWLPLAEGDPHPLPDVEPRADITLPSHTHVGAPHIGCSLLAPRSMPLFVAMQIVRERAMKRLRVERGLSYAIAFGEDRVGLHHSLLSLSCDTAEGHTAEAIDELIDLLDGVAGGQLTDEEVLIACDAAMPWNATDPGRPATEAQRKAVGDLIGHTPATWSDLAREAASIGPSEVAGALKDALDTAILCVPEEEAVPERFASHPSEPRQRLVLGRNYVRWDGNAMDQVVFGEMGVSRSFGPNVAAVMFDECELAAFAPNGTVWLVDERGDGLVVELNQLRGGKELAAADPRARARPRGGHPRRRARVVRAAEHGRGA